MSLYVARHKSTGLYTHRLINFFMGQKDWVATLDPAEEVELMREQLTWLATRRPILTDEIYNADMWSDWTISEYSKYLEDVDFLPITLGVENVGPDGWGQTSVTLSQP